MIPYLSQYNSTVVASEGAVATYIFNPQILGAFKISGQMMTLLFFKF